MIELVAKGLGKERLTLIEMLVAETILSLNFNLHGPPSDAELTGARKASLDAFLNTGRLDNFGVNELEDFAFWLDLDHHNSF